MKRMSKLPKLGTFLVAVGVVMFFVWVTNFNMNHQYLTSSESEMVYLVSYIVSGLSLIGGGMLIPGGCMAYSSGIVILIVATVFYFAIGINRIPPQIQ